jgi:hypothetical protein
MVDDATKHNMGLITRLRNCKELESAWYFNCSVYGKTLDEKRIKFDIFDDINIEHICKFLVVFFSATIDDRNLIFVHKLHIGTPYRGKRFLTHQILTFCLPKSGGIISELFNVYKNQQTGSRNLMGPKTLPTIWGTYMKLVTKYQIPVINSCLEKCD